VSAAHFYIHSNSLPTMAAMIYSALPSALPSGFVILKTDLGLEFVNGVSGRHQKSLSTSESFMELLFYQRMHKSPKSVFDLFPLLCILWFFCYTLGDACVWFLAQLEVSLHLLSSTLGGCWCLHHEPNI
jgi:hypothetical protein